MANKKAQGLPLNLIVLAAVAALVLVLVIAFTVGGTGSFFGKIFRGGTAAVGDELSVALTTCNSLCDQAKTISSSNAWKGTGFCARTFNIDRDGDGKIGGFTKTGSKSGSASNPTNYASTSRSSAPIKERSAACADIGSTCTADITTAAGGLVSCDHNECTTGCT